VQKHPDTEGATQREELLQQQLKQANETIAALTEHLNRMQLETGMLFHVMLLAELSYLVINGLLVSLVKRKEIKRYLRHQFKIVCIMFVCKKNRVCVSVIWPSVQKFIYKWSKLRSEYTCSVAGTNGSLEQRRQPLPAPKEGTVSAGNLLAFCLKSQSVVLRVNNMVLLQVLSFVLFLVCVCIHCKQK